MSARMWKVREALMQPATDKADYDRRVAALAEVEEWEARARDDDTALRLCHQDIEELESRAGRLLARAEAAEARVSDLLSQLDVAAQMVNELGEKACP